MILEAKQPEERHSFRPGRRLEEYLLTANLLLDKAAAAFEILDEFVKAVGKIGLRLNVDNAVMLTNEAQPPNTFVTKQLQYIRG